MMMALQMPELWYLGPGYVVPTDEAQRRAESVLYILAPISMLQWPEECHVDI